MSLTGRQLESCLTNRRLHLIVLPTEACNFRCTYCYESFQHKLMAPEVIRGVQNLLTRRAPGLDSLTISWFGGEPLLARRHIETILEHVRDLRRLRSGLEFVSDMTTNGYLLSPAAAERLIDLGVTQYQISFDGPRAWHDRKRVLQGGKGTFDRIWGNLVSLQALPREFSVTVRLHADRENEAVVPEFLDLYAGQFGADERFELFPRLLSRFGGPNDSLLNVYDREEGKLVLDRMRAMAAERGIRMLPAAAGTAVCYASRGNSFLIRSTGRVGKCTIALDHPNNDVGSLSEDGSIQLDQPKVLQWMRGLRSRDEGELHCPMKGYADRASLPREGMSPPLAPIALLPSVPRAAVQVGGG